MVSVAASAWGYLADLLDVPSIVRNLSRHRELIRTMAWHQFVARYRPSFGGLLWAVVQPLVMMVVYTLVFSVFLRLRFSTTDTPFYFAVYVLCGLLAWSSFAEPVAASASLIRSNPNYVKRIVFPLEVLPLNTVVAAAIQQVLGFLLLLPLTWIVTRQLGWTLALVPLVLVLQILLVAGACWFVSSLAVFLPDIGQLIALALSVMMLMTPIFYAKELVPDWARVIFLFNPMALLIECYRDLIVRGQLPPADTAVRAAILCTVTFLVGYFWFMRTKNGFADVL
jgi:lipopolysaccharide transport system permease protein